MMAIDTQTGLIDIDSEAAPTVERDRLYRLWEEGNWSAKNLDFTTDAVEWKEQLDEAQHKAFLWNYALFLDGEESVTVTLNPFVQAVQRYEDRIFLATQIADEARHHVFFDRFLREVAGIGTGYADTLAIMRRGLTWGYNQVFTELDRVADRLRLNPNSLPLLAQGLAIYHLTVEGMLAHTGQHFMREYCNTHSTLPGFATGINLIARDESRHIAFGIQLLRELVTTNPSCKAAAIAELNKVLPWAAGVFTPPNMDWTYIQVFGYSPEDVFTFGLRSIETKLRRAGIMPEEVLALVKLGAHRVTPAEQAKQVKTLIEGGIIGTDAPPNVTEPTLDALFTSMCYIADWATPRNPPLHATIQWIFDDAQPRHLVLGEAGGARAVVGRAAQPRLTLRCSAADWGRIAGGRLNQQQAVLTRRLRISGDWGMALRLPKILPA
jgi:hypothetical protein